MILEQSWLQVEPDAKKVKGRLINVLACKLFIDSFGKYYTFTDIFDSYSTVELILKDKEKLLKQGKNCLDKFEGWKL